MKRIEMLFNRIYFSIYSLLYFTNRFVIGKIIEPHRDWYIDPME